MEDKKNFSNNEKVFVKFTNHVSELIKFNHKVNNIDWAEELSIPICIFNNPCLSGLETITKFLKEDVGFSYHEIALLLNRDERTIWGAYQSSRSQRSAKPPIPAS